MREFAAKRQGERREPGSRKISVRKFMRDGILNEQLLGFRKD